MKRSSRFISWGLMALACCIFANKTSADVFAQVPSGSVLYRQLAVVKNASWENDNGVKVSRSSKANEQTRYEFAIEIAKSAIDFSAHRQANSAWLDTVPRGELRSLRALVTEFSVELAGFNVDTKDIISSIDEALRNPSSPSIKDQIDLTTPTNTEHTSTLSTFPLALDLSSVQSAEVVNMSLFSQLALYAQMTTPTNSLLRANSQSALLTEDSSMLAEANTSLRAGANMHLNDWLSLRAGYDFNQMNQPQTLQQTLLANNNSSWFSNLGSTGSIGGGLDVKVSPGLTLSGGISRLSLNNRNGKNEFSGTQLEGGVGVSGLNNRLLLSARLARLMPDDAASLASTAARLNLDFALSNNLSLNLLYQQMFSLSPQQDGKSTFAGGVNIHF